MFTLDSRVEMTQNYFLEQKMTLDKDAILSWKRLRGWQFYIVRKERFGCHRCGFYVFFFFFLKDFY